MMFVLKCPKCLHDMKYQTNSGLLLKKRKTCVYCGQSFLVKERILKRIV